MHVAWTQHIKDPAEKEKYIGSVRHAGWILEDLLQILDGIDRGLERQELSTKVYESNNWAYKQADCNGYRRCLNLIRSIINLDQQEKTDNDRKPI